MFIDYIVFLFLQVYFINFLKLPSQRVDRFSLTPVTQFYSSKSPSKIITLSKNWNSKDVSFKPFHTTGIFCTSWKQTKTRDFQMFSEDVERNCGIKWPNEYLENYRYIIVLKFQSIIEFYMDWISFWFLEWLPFPLSKQSDKQLLIDMVVTIFLFCK